MMQFVVDGIVNASLIALGAVGLSMTYNILRFANFAQGEIVATGAYISLAVVVLLGGGIGAIGPLAFGWPLVFALAVSLAGTSIVVLILDWMLFRELRSRRASRITLIMAAFGVSLMGRNLITLIAGGDPVYFSFYIQNAIEILPGAKATPDEVAQVVIAAACVLALYLFLTRTTMGKQMRATSENPTLAQVNGIDTRAVIRWTWIIGACLAAVAGTLQGHTIQLRPEMGFDLLLPMFAALILGGVGSVFGTVVGALIIGLGESFAVAAGLSAYRLSVTFLVMIAILLIRPHGLFGERA